MQRLTSMYVHRFSGTSVSGVSELSMCRTCVRMYVHVCADVWYSACTDSVCTWT